MVITDDFESSDRSSNLLRSFFFSFINEMESDYAFLSLDPKCTINELETTIVTIRMFFDPHNFTKQSPCIQSLTKHVLRDAEKSYLRIKNSKSQTITIPSLSSWLPINGTLEYFSENNTLTRKLD